MEPSSKTPVAATRVKGLDTPLPPPSAFALSRPLRSEQGGDSSVHAATDAAKKMKKTHNDELSQSVRILRGYILKCGE